MYSYIFSLIESFIQLKYQKSFNKTYIFFKKLFDIYNSQGRINTKIFPNVYATVRYISIITYCSYELTSNKYYALMHVFLSLPGQMQIIFDIRKYRVLLHKPKARKRFNYLSLIGSPSLVRINRFVPNTPKTAFPLSLPTIPVARTIRLCPQNNDMSVCVLQNWRHNFTGFVTRVGTERNQTICFPLLLLGAQHIAKGSAKTFAKLN